MTESPPLAPARDIEPFGLARAREAVSAREFGSLRRIAAGLALGTPASDVADQLGPNDPMGALVRAAIASGDPATVLEAYCSAREEANRVHRMLLLSLAYPFSILVLSLVIALGQAWLLLPLSLNTLRELEVMPFWERWLAAFPGGRAAAAQWTMLAALAALVALLAGAFVYFGLRRRFRRPLWSWPFVGAILAWERASEAFSLVASMIGRGMPLPIALRHAATISRSRRIRASLESAARDIEAGAPLSRTAVSGLGMGLQIESILAWGEQTGQVAEALRLLARLLMAMARARGERVASILPGFVMVMSLLLLFGTLCLVILPLFESFQMLTS